MPMYFIETALNKHTLLSSYSVPLFSEPFSPDSWSPSHPVHWGFFTRKGGGLSGSFSPSVDSITGSQYCRGHLRGLTESSRLAWEHPRAAAPSLNHSSLWIVLRSDMNVLFTKTGKVSTSIPTARVLLQKVLFLKVIYPLFMYSVHFSLDFLR